MTKEEEDVAIDDEYLEPEIKLVLDGTPEDKKLYYRFIKKWHDLLDSFDKEYRLILLKLILDVSSYNEDISNVMNMKNSESYTNLMFFLLTMMIQQKRIDRSNTSSDKKKDVKLLDFMPS